MKKRNSKIMLLVVGVFIGLLLVFHLKTPFLMESDFPTEEIKAKDELLKEFLDEQAYLQSRIVTLREQLQEKQESISTHSDDYSIERLEELKKDLGLTEVSGRGVEVVMDDSPFALREGAEVSDNSLVQAADLRDVVNILNAADAKAISINGQRVIATSPISSVGTTLLVNNTHISPPFVINAVGEQDIILQRLLTRSNLEDIYARMETNNLRFEITVKNQHVIPIYNGDLKTDHINLIEE